MRSSLFGFYRAYFGYTSSKKIHFARAIMEAQGYIEESIDNNVEVSVLEYQSRPFSRQLTSNFLSMFNEIAYQYYDFPYNQLTYHTNTISFSKELLESSKKLDIDFGYCYDATQRKIIFLEYGKLDEVSKWFRVFRTLSEHFDIESPLPIVDEFWCWDLLRGTTYHTNFSTIQLSPYSRVLETAKRLVSA